MRTIKKKSSKIFEKKMEKNFNKKKKSFFSEFFTQNRLFMSFHHSKFQMDKKYHKKVLTLSECPGFPLLKKKGTFLK